MQSKEAEQWLNDASGGGGVCKFDSSCCAHISGICHHLVIKQPTRGLTTQTYTGPNQPINFKILLEREDRGHSTLSLSISLLNWSSLMCVGVRITEQGLEMIFKKYPLLVLLEDFSLGVPYFTDQHTFSNKWRQFSELCDFWKYAYAANNTSFLLTEQISFVVTQWSATGRPIFLADDRTHFLQSNTALWKTQRRTPRSEVGIYKRKQENKKKERTHALNQESDQEND